MLRAHGVPLADEREVTTPQAAVAAADELGYPVVAQAVRRRDRPQDRARPGAAAARRRRRGGESPRSNCSPEATPADGDVSLLVAPMVAGNRELIAGVVRDPQFGANVMLGVGGILAEAIADVVFRPAPIDAVDAEEMIDGLATQKLLGEFRGEAGRRPPATDGGAARAVGIWSLPDPTSSASTSTR